MDSASSAEAGTHGLDEVDDSSVWTLYLLT